jgi:hypothetical protein
MLDTEGIETKSSSSSLALFALQRLAGTSIQK